MPFADITTTGSDVEVFSVPFDKIYKIKGLYIKNKSSSDATVRILDKYTYNLGTSAGTEGSRTLIELKISANAEENLSRLEGEEIIGGLYVNSDQEVYVYVGIEEKSGE